MSIYKPENYREKVRQDDIYAGLLTGDYSRAASKTVMDTAYAQLYARNLFQHLRPLGLNTAGSVVDMGCGGGVIPDAFNNLVQGTVWGIDMSPSAIAFASETFDGPSYVNGSADQLEMIGDHTLSLVHAREFYPFSRTNDTDLHMRFLEAAYPKLMDGGLFAVVQIRDPKVGAGIHENLRRVQSQSLDIGYKRVGMNVMVPQFFYRRFGGLGHSFPIRMGLEMAGRVLELIKPGKVNFFYWLQA